MKDFVIKCGNDAVSDERIEKHIGDKDFLERIFQPSEIHNNNARKLSGIFALKEAVFKALEIQSNNWFEIEVVYKTSGKPTIKLSDAVTPKGLISIDCSVSHCNGESHAIVVMILANILD